MLLVLQEKGEGCVVLCCVGWWSAAARQAWTPPPLLPLPQCAHARQPASQLATQPAASAKHAPAAHAAAAEDPASGTEQPMGSPSCCGGRGRRRGGVGWGMARTRPSLWAAASWAMGRRGQSPACDASMCRHLSRSGSLAVRCWHSRPNDGATHSCAGIAHLGA